jgi:hypothetical protein
MYRYVIYIYIYAPAVCAFNIYTYFSNGNRLAVIRVANQNLIIPRRIL